MYAFKKYIYIYILIKFISWYLNVGSVDMMITGLCLFLD